MLNKILENQVQQHIKRLIHHNQMRLTLGMQAYSVLKKKKINVIHHINRPKKENHMVISNDAEKNLTKFNTIHDSNSNNSQ